MTERGPKPGEVRYEGEGLIWYVPEECVDPDVDKLERISRLRRAVKEGRVRLVPPDEQ